MQLWNMKMSKPGLLPISSSTMQENNNRIYLIRYPIFQIEIVSKYTLRYTKPCVLIIVKMNMNFWCYIKNPSFQFRNSRPGPGITTNFTDTHFPSKHKSLMEETNESSFSFKILSHPKSCVYFQSISQKDI